MRPARLKHWSTAAADGRNRSTPDQKRAFFTLCAGSIVCEINSFDARNAIVVFLSCDGRRHQSVFDADGCLTYTATQRESGYGEADLSVPLEVAAAGPDVQWELWTIGAAARGREGTPETDCSQTGTRPLSSHSWDSGRST